MSSNNAQTQVLRRYLEELARVTRQGDAREESFYPALAEFIRSAAQVMGRSDVQVTILPRPTEAGNPDFRVWDGTSHIVGYIEAKAPTEELLDRVEASEQLRRYRDTFPNLILTNFLEFRLYRNGERVASALLGQPAVLTARKPSLSVENADQVWGLLQQFLGFTLPRPLTPGALAIELAKRTRFLRDVVARQLAEETAAKKGQLFGFYEAFKKFLIASLTKEEFADLYAQTITYGLFAARTRATDGFSRRAAFDYIPYMVGVLRDLFRYISLDDLPAEIEWTVEDIAEVLSVADVAEMMERYYREGRGSDPVVHFYETFLAHYDPEERERRGVYYTPDPVVSYIVRSLHQLLKSRFGLRDGLASREVTLLDPAAGTMAFVARAAEEAVREFTQKYGDGSKGGFIREHILRNFYAFELMVAPYTVGHLKMAFFLEELGYRLQKNERLPFYLTNTLDMSELEGTNMPILSSLAEESRLAGRVKQEEPILVILGNPPYSGHSANKGKWILSQIEAYKQVDGKPLGEKNLKWLQDDYVKFIRFAQWKIEQAGQGMVGMITNHAYLDNPTFRGMRRSLMQTFDEIYILDLHGNSLKRERCPDGSPDENVFDIRQGVVIAFFIKTKKGKGEARVYHADLWGKREDKYTWLQKHDVETTPWREIHPKPEFYLFVPRDEAELARYNTFPKVTDIFQEYSAGIVTARDRLTIHWTEEDVWTTVQNFSRMDPERARQVYQLGSDARDWKVTLAQQDLRDSGPDRRNIVPILYRPFDVRYTYYTGRSRGFHCRPRPEVMRHMLAGDNVALVTVRQVAEGVFNHAFVTQNIVESRITLSNKGIGFLFPLYLYPGSERPDLLSHLEPQEPRLNLNPKVLESLAKAYGEAPTPEEVFHYIYAVLYASSYREKYADFLRLDFPRIPFPADREVFAGLAALGKRLVDLHLLRSDELDPPLAKFEGQGDNQVGGNKRDGVHYDAERQRVYINPTQYFAPVPPEVWEYIIGGYQVCLKWLKERQGRHLSLNEIQTYCRMVTALTRTMEVQSEIDEYYARVEAATVAFSSSGIS